MQKFASIGKALLIRAIGIQENYIEEITDIIDQERSGCKDCIHSFFPGCKECAECNSKCYKTKKIYINEKNMYGTQTRLNANALKMLIYFHFLRPDANGIIKNVPINDITKILKCDRRTVINNMKLLDKHGYIKYSQTYHGTRNILILNYKDAFKKADEGGKGYVVFNESLINKLLNIDKIVLLRIFLRNMVEIDNYNKDDRSSINMVTKTYRSMRRFLPSYCTKKVIDKIITAHNDADIFHVKKQGEAFVFSLNNDCIGKRQRRELVKKYYDDLSKFLRRLNEASIEKNKKGLRNDSEFYDILFDISSPKLMILTEEELMNLAQLAVYYEYDVVVDAILHSLKYKSDTGDNVKSYGAYIRNYIEKAYGRMASQAFFCCSFFIFSFMELMQVFTFFYFALI